jgi:RNA polymerase sigma-70 factor (ECF subfamily)
MAAKSGKITEEIINAEYQAVYHYILSLCRDEKEAEDITQDTFVKAISTESFRGESSYYSWLCSIGRNIWIDKCRKSGILQFEEMPEEALPAASESPPLEEVIADGELLRQVHRIIHKMDEPYKEVFTLKVFGDLSFKDISFLFGKTESWARVTYHRARKKIIEMLRKENWL